MTPIINHGAHALKTKKSTAPFLLCDISALADENIKQAREVPTATNIRFSDSISRIEKSKTRAGTTANPPPFPKSPAVSPAMAPAVISKTSNPNISKGCSKHA